MNGKSETQKKIKTVTRKSKKKSNIFTFKRQI